MSSASEAAVLHHAEASTVIVEHGVDPLPSAHQQTADPALLAGEASHSLEQRSASFKSSSSPSCSAAAEESRGADITTSAPTVPPVASCSSSPVAVAEPTLEVSSAGGDKDVKAKATLSPRGGTPRNASSCSSSSQPAVEVCPHRAVEALKLSMSPRGGGGERGSTPQSSSRPKMSALSTLKGADGSTYPELSQALPSPRGNDVTTSQTPRTTGTKIYRSRLALPELNCSFHSLIMHYLSIRPDSLPPPFICPITSKTWSAAQTIETTKKMATQLHAHGFRKGDCLMMHAPNCWEYRVCSLAVMALGGVFSVANPQFRGDELQVQLEDCKATWVVTYTAIKAAALEACGAVGIPKERFILIAGVGTPAGAEKDERCTSFDEFVNIPTEAISYPEVSTDMKEDVAFLPYSSGTTGRPKGVMITHHNLVSNLTQLATVDKMRQEHTLAVLPFFHVYGFTLLNLACVTHSSMILFPKFDLALFLSSIEKFKVQYLFIVPPIVALLAFNPLVDKFNLSSVKLITSGAAPLPETTETRVQQRLGIRVRGGYGMSELTTAATISSESRFKPNSVGELAPGTEMRLVDPDTLADAEEGEIWVRGPQVMKGYWGREEDTKATVREDGFLRTGDIGKLDAEGFLYITDRLKDLVKYKGHQVCPTELEAVLLLHPNVLDCAVVSAINEEKEEIPKAFIVLKTVEGEKTTEEEIMEFVSQRVSAFKKVRAVSFIKEIPRTASGKILRRQLKLMA